MTEMEMKNSTETAINYKLNNEENTEIINAQKLDAKNMRKK